MRLSSLKLSGFKSFADSTTLHFKDNRTAVVGPNGCGKSNVIDAIRWVMGESSARQLRGGSMQDVIFTGTSKRKPVGMASVELRFDNTYGKLGGAYNAYSELSVRRQVTRDGKSEYFLNGTRCRRRDITDIFLGTGLGPRSYAVIEQGMITRLVDAKPEEMRVFIEEAAGVSRYQARRRETMQHLEHTEQNLARLDDIASELKSQLRTLKRQSEAAIQYKNLEQQIRTLKVEILSFQARRSQKLQQEYTVEMNQLGEEFKLIRSELHTIEHDLESTSHLFQRLIEQSSPLQQEWQLAEKTLSELKMTVEQKQSIFQQHSQALLNLDQQKRETKERLQLSELQLENLVVQEEELAESYTHVEQCLRQDEQAVADLQAQNRQIVQEFEQLKAQVDQQLQKKSQMQAQLEQLNKNILRLEQQKETLFQQQQRISAQVQHESPERLTLTQQALKEEITQTESEIEQLRGIIDKLQQQIQQIKTQQQEIQTEIQVLKSEQKHLEQLVVKHQPKNAAPVMTLMSSLQLSAAGKQHAQVIEKFLSKWLNAQLLTDADTFRVNVGRQIKSSIQKPLSHQGVMLSDWIDSPQSSLWSQVVIVEQLDEALTQQEQLKLGESILTKDGYHVGPDWVIALRYDEESQSAQGILSHRVRLEEIQSELEVLLSQLDQINTDVLQQQQRVQEKQQQLKNLIEKAQQQQKQQQALDIEIAKQQTAAQAYLVQQQQLNDQIKQLELQLEEDAMQRDDLEIDLHAVALKLDTVLPTYKAAQYQVESVIEQLEAQQQSFQTQQQTFDTQRRALEQVRTQIELLDKDVSILKTQYQQCIQQIQNSQALVEPIQAELPALETRYQEQQEVTERLQKKWSEWQVELNQVQEKQKHLTEQRHLFQQRDETVREKLEQKRLAWQSAKSDHDHYHEQLKELHTEPLASIEIDLPSHQQKLEKTQQQFDKIGAVNLAASEEFEEVSQRFDELSHQMQDLENTVVQLKDAMKSIDQETRKLFMTTFDQINQELQHLFPKVFSGGEASLSLEDDWQSGVRLMARPPGKRNTSIALLSGGEKTLTALALVFAIFRLNPAPFCVLDEVDAPLDDANVQRYCNLVKELSEQVQFIYITHNKLAMMMATDLLGVTMPEPGTSKLVTVNLEQAKEYGLVAES